MPDDNELRPSESSEVYIHDQDTAVRQQRARTAAANYRAHAGWTNPSNFQPAPAAPSDDPEPPSEGDDISPGESVKVGYYDGLLPSHRNTTSTEVTRFGTELANYKTYYDDHIRQPGQPRYQMPTSQVTPLDVTDDGAERPSESNLVGDYDVATGGYSGISVSSTGTTGTQGSAYTQKLASANSKFAKLQSETDNDGIKKTFERLTSNFDTKYGRDDSSQTDRSKMSVVEAGKKDVATIKGGINTKFRDASLYGGTDSAHPGTSSEPATNTVKWLGPTVETRVEEMVDNIMSKLIAPSEFNTLCDEMLGYINQNKTYSQWKSARGSNYSNRFTEAMMQNCWNCALTRTELYKTMAREMLNYIRQNWSYSQWKSARGSNYSGKFSNSIMQKCWNDMTDYNNQT